MDPPQFLSELKRRTIYFRGFLYLVMASVVILVAEVVLRGIMRPGGVS